MTRRQRCSMPRRPGGLRWRRPLTVLLGLTVLLALPETVKSLMKQSVWPLESVSTTM